MWTVEANDSGIYEVEFPLYDQVVKFRVSARNKQHALNKSMAIWLRRRGLSISENIGPELRKWDNKARINRVEDSLTQKPGKEETVAPPITPSEDQMNLPGINAFVKTTDNQHPGAAIADSWKKSRKMQFMTFDQLAELIGDDPAFLSVKLDGELVALVLEEENVSAVTNKGTIRTEFPAALEAAELLGKKHKKAILIAEMYIVNEEGSPQTYMTASKILRNPDSGE
ncbi:hypothetical protein LCGC14_2968740, partial [marine sediment metagenome]